MYCQVCGLKNSDDEEFCARCNSKLLVLSGVGVVEESGEPQEEIPFDEHLLERISTLEDVVKRTAEAVKSLFESMGNLEKNLFVAHTGILALQETLERRGAVRAEEVVDLWESKMDERMQAVEKKDRFLERRDRIIARFSGPDREGFLRKLREAEFAILALDADRGIRVLEELFRGDRANVELGFYLAETFFSGGELERAIGVLQEDPGGRPESLRGPRLQRHRGLRVGRHGGGRGGAESRGRAQARRVPAALRARDALRAPVAVGGGGEGPRPRPRLRAGPVGPHPARQRAAREGRAVAGDPRVRGGDAPGARVRGGGLPARALLPREELAQARARVLPAGAREEPAPPRVPGGRAPARAPQRVRAAPRGRSRRGRVQGRGGERRPRGAVARAGALPQGHARRAAQSDDPRLLRAPLGVHGALEGSDRRLPRGARRGPGGRRRGGRLLDAGRGAAGRGQPARGRGVPARVPREAPVQDGAGGRVLRARDEPGRVRRGPRPRARLRRPRARGGARGVEALSARRPRLGPLQAPGVRPGDRVPAPLERPRRRAR